MPDRETMELRGPVRTVLCETLDYDKQQGQWKQPFRLTETAFNRDGSTARMIEYDPDGSVSKVSYVYDGFGSLQKSRCQTDDGPFTENLYQYDELRRLKQKTVIGLDGSVRVEESYYYEPDGRKLKVYWLDANLTQEIRYPFDGSENLYGARGVSAITTIYDPQLRRSI